MAHYEIHELEAGATMWKLRDIKTRKVNALKRARAIHDAGGRKTEIRVVHIRRTRLDRELPVAWFAPVVGEPDGAHKI